MRGTSKPGCIATPAPCSVSPSRSSRCPTGWSRRYEPPSRPRPRDKAPERRAYWQAATPSFVAGATAGVFTKIAQVTSGLVTLLFVIVALQPPPITVGPASLLPALGQKFTVPTVGGVVQEVLPLYLIESAKNDSSDVSRLRRSDFIEAIGPGLGV